MTVGPTGAAVRVHHAADLGPTVRLVTGFAVDDPPAEKPNGFGTPPNLSKSNGAPTAPAPVEKLQKGERPPIDPDAT